MLIDGNTSSQKLWIELLKCLQVYNSLNIVYPISYNKAAISAYLSRSGTVHSSMDMFMSSYIIIERGLVPTFRILKGILS